MSATITVDAEVLSDTCYALDDEKLIGMMLMALDLLHEHAETPEAANTVTVAKCSFEAIMARWLPTDAVSAAWETVVGSRDAS